MPAFTEQFTGQIANDYLDRAFKVMQRNDALSKMESDDEKIQAAWRHLKNAAPYCASGYQRERFLRFYKDYAELIKKSTVCTEIMKLHSYY